jgi:hypothetical protein
MQARTHSRPLLLLLLLNAVRPLQHVLADDAPALPNQKFLGDSLYKSTFASPSKRKEEAAETPFSLSPSRKKPAYLVIA